MWAFLTTGEVARRLGQPEWLVRRLVDRLAPPVERFGGKRIIPVERLEEIDQAIQRRCARGGQP